ncbi:MAG: acetate--CoA ligase family protein [Burkholderiales bacterium]|nr:acetate--CoA ligase family protein [Burkholderiales bacterium]
MGNTIDRILNPRRLAVIGASNDPLKRGYRAIKTLLADRYRGEILPINPRAPEILGLRSYSTIEAAPGEIDLAIVCTPAAAAPEVIEGCGRKGVLGALLLAGGFSEASEAGRVLEERTLEVARRYGVRLIGPNTNGLFSARLDCNAIAWFDIPRGPLALLANSANVILSIVVEAQHHGYFGLSTILSVGNQTDIQFHEYLDAFAADPGTGVVVCYVEGFKNAPAFLAAARRITPEKPIVMFLSGRSAEGKRAARSHSGSLAGDYAVGSGTLVQAGVTLVTEAQQLFPVAEALSLFPPMRGKRVAVLSEGGGVITIAAEALAARGMELATLDSRTQARIHAIVPAASTISNPVDAGGGTDPRATYYGSISRAILEDPNIDALLLVGFFGGYGRRYGDEEAAVEKQVAVELGELMRAHGKPVMVQSHYADYRTEALDILRKGGVPFQRHIEIAVHCLAAAAQYHASRRRIVASCATHPAALPAVREIVARARAAGRSALLETEARATLVAAGVPMPANLLLRSPEDAARAAQLFGGQPIALKVVSKDVLHKSEAGAVRLGVRGETAIADGVRAIHDSVLAHVPGALIEGVLATPMAPRGVELIVGVTRDPQFGPVVMFGLGGIFVEAIRDVVFRSVPIALEDAHEMVGGIAFKALLDGVRALPAVDRDAIALLLVKVSALAAAHPEIAEIDLNPVIAHAGGYTVADARAILAAQ